MRPAASPPWQRGPIEARLLELRRHHPSWGQVRLRHQLEREGLKDVPSLSGIYRALRRESVFGPF